MIRRVSRAPAALRTTTLALVIGTSLLAAPGVALAGSAPANDSIAAATQIAFLPFEDSSADNSSATVEDGEADVGCFGDIDATVWYQINPSSSYAIRVRVLPEVGFDSVVAVYDRTPFNAIAIACADDGAAGSRETTVASLMSGRSYFIQVGGRTNGNTTGQFTLKVKHLPGPANDHFADAANVALGSIATATTTTATLEAEEVGPSCGPSIGRTVWYRYTPTTTRTLVAKTVGSDYDTILAAYTGESLDALNEVACNDDRGIDLASKIRFTAVAGTTYYFQVGGFWGSAGELVLRLKTP